MKRIMLSVCGIAILAAIVFCNACKKGDTGPQGPKGTANVIYSNWVATNPWVASTTSTGSGKVTYYFDITAQTVTQSIIDSGTVLVYAKFLADPDGGGIAKLLPSTYYNLGSANSQYHFQHGLFVSKIRIICDIIPAGTPSTSNMVRYVVIPAGQLATGRLMKPDYSKMTYSEVCSMYNIPE
ncbi:MAG: hypothetical protein QM731_16500 [Chitinophagaceae bacterium]